MDRSEHVGLFKGHLVYIDVSVGIVALLLLVPCDVGDFHQFASWNIHGTHRIRSLPATYLAVGIAEMPRNRCSTSTSEPRLSVTADQRSFLSTLES